MIDDQLNPSDWIYVLTNVSSEGELKSGLLDGKLTFNTFPTCMENSPPTAERS